MNPNKANNSNVEALTGLMPGAKRQDPEIAKCLRKPHMGVLEGVGTLDIPTFYNPCCMDRPLRHPAFLKPPPINFS